MKTFVRTSIGLCSALLLVIPDAAYACEKCFGAIGDEPTIKAVVMSMASLLIMVSVVGGGIGLFFVNMRKRIKMMEPGDFVVTEYGDLRSSLPNDSGR